MSGKKTSGFLEILSLGEFSGLLEEVKLNRPTEVQFKVMPEMLKQVPLSVLAPTGSGKTFCFLLPLFEILKKDELDGKTSDLPKALVLAPTKELAEQIFKEAKKVAHHVKIRVRLLVGGETKDRILKRKNQKEVMDLVIGVPGKIAKLIEKNEVDFSELKHIVFDEADQLLDNGFKADLEKILKHVNKNEGLTPSVFTATRPFDFAEVLKNYFPLVEFKDIALQDAHKLKQSVKTFSIPVHYEEKFKLLMEFLKKQAKGKGIVFFNQKKDAEKVYTELMKEDGKKHYFLLHGETKASERLKVLKAFTEGQGVLFASDVAARGLDVQDLIWVLNYDLPFETVYYIHRAGRVGRMGKEGLVYNFVTTKDLKLVEKINDTLKNQTALKLEGIKAPKPRDPSAVKKAAKKKVVKKVTKAGPPAKKSGTFKGKKDDKKTFKRSPLRSVRSKKIAGSRAKKKK